jgi:hypothetical protein
MSHPRKLSLLHARWLTVGVLGLVGVMAGSSVAATDPATPTPVKDDPGVLEMSPSAYELRFAWRQYSNTKPYHDSYYVQRGTQQRIKVNAPGTSALSGGVLDKAVIYAQQRGRGEVQLYNFDLRTKTRSPMPRAVNAARYGKKPVTITGEMSASGPLVLFRGMTPALNDPAGLDIIFLYNRVTKKLQALDSIQDDHFGVSPGQVNGSWATWVDNEQISSYVTHVYRRNLKTGRTYKITLGNGADPYRGAVNLHDSAIGSDGTLYYWRYDERSGTDPTPHELVRKPVVGAARVIQTVLNGPNGTFVQDRPDGTKAVYYTLGGDILKIIDTPS